jgi:predicted enzyme related to lactoylglutathione lyase
MSMALNIGSEEPKALIEYYRALFGTPFIERGGYASWMLEGNMITVGPHTDVKGKNPSPGRVMWSLMSGDIKADYERYKAAGATVVRELYQDPDAPFMIATFSDPDDNYFQIVAQA